MISPLRRFGMFLTVAAGLGLAACDGKEQPKPAQQAAPPPPEVVVATVQARDVPLTFDYAGRVSGYREVEVRARVAGILLKRTYEEGATVRQGDVLFRIDPAPFEAALAGARAQLQRAEAASREALRNFERRNELLRRGVVAQAGVDEAQANRDTAAADVAVARANLRTAELNLGYTKVVAPVGGVTSLETRSEGSLVGTAADSSLLTTITQLDPVYVNFAIPDAEALSLQSLIASGRVTAPAEGQLPVEIRSGAATTVLAAGTLDFTSSTIDPETGTLRARALVPNPDRKLLPGQFVRITAGALTLKGVVTVVQKALLQGPQGQMVYVVDGQNQAQARPVKVSRMVGDAWVVDQGLAAGDRIVTEGVIKVRPGAPVRIAAAPLAGAGNTNAGGTSGNTSTGNAASPGAPANQAANQAAPPSSTQGGTQEARR